MPSVAILGTRGYPSFYGGFETAVRMLAPYLADHGWDVSVYGRKPDDNDGAGDPRVRSIVTPGIDSKSLSTLSRGLTSTAHAAWMKPDVALVMNVANGYFLPLLKARGVPTVVNVDGIEWEREKWGRLARTIFYHGARSTARWADELIVDAEAIGDYWSKRFGRGGRFVPYGGWEQTALPLVEGLTPRGYVLVVARFVPENTIPEFFDAVDSLAHETHVVIVGSSGYGGELDDRARELASRHDTVRWLGHVKDDSKLHSLWQHAGAYFHGHSVGGTNPALVQAMALGAPTVARDTSFNREVLSESGVFVEPTAPGIVEGLLSVLGDSDLQTRLSESARQRARERYSWESVCAGYERALREVIAASRH